MWRQCTTWNETKFDLNKPKLALFDILGWFLWNSLSSEANSLVSVGISGEPGSLPFLIHFLMQTSLLFSFLSCKSWYYRQLEGKHYTDTSMHYFCWRPFILYRQPVNVPECEHTHDITLLQFKWLALNQLD
jgi:hypothetical protein